MHLLTLIGGIVLLPKANALKCYECYGSGTCTGTEKECLSVGFQCGAMTIASYKVGGAKVAEVYVKSCVGPEQCNEGSVNFGITKTIVTNKCCTSDLCNVQPAPETINTIPNGKKCFHCNGRTCNETLTCEGNEDHCISVTVAAGGESRILKGCASSQMCSNVNNAEVQAIEGEISCCQGDYCNSAGSTGASLLLLVAPLVSLVIFS